MHPYTTLYNTQVLPKLKEFKNYESAYEIPRVTKVSVNCGVGDVMNNGKELEEVAALVTSITGQKAVETKARKAVSGFKIRQNNVVGLKTTLRGERMRDFLYKFLQISLPRTRDFRGIKPTSVTKDGNLNVGIKDSVIFPEAAEAIRAHGLQVTLVSNAKTKEEALALYQSMGFVFNNEVVEAKKRKGVKRNYKK